MDKTDLRGWIATEWTSSKIFYGTLRRVLAQDRFNGPIWDFVNLVSVPPWILESLVHTAIFRWRSLLHSRSGRSQAAFLTYCYLDTGKFFQDEIAETIRVDFSIVIVETAARLLQQPHPELSSWN